MFTETKVGGSESLTHTRRNGGMIVARVVDFEVPKDLAWVNGIVDVRDEIFLPRAEDRVRVDAVQLFHSPGREDRIPYGTKVLHVSGDDLHAFRIESELSEGCSSVDSSDCVVDVVASAFSLGDGAVHDGVLVEIAHALLRLEFAVALPVAVARVWAGLATADEVGHDVC